MKILYYILKTINFFLTCFWYLLRIFNGLFYPFYILSKIKWGDLTMNKEILTAIKKAQKFYNKFGFMDISRFSSYFKNELWKSDDERIKNLIELYIKTFSK